MVNGLSLLGSAVAVATPRSDCSGGGLLCTLGEQGERKKKSSRSSGAQK